MNDLLIRRKELAVHKTGYTRLVLYEWTYQPRADLVPILVALVTCTAIGNLPISYRVACFGHVSVSVLDVDTLDDAFTSAYTHATETLNRTFAS